MVGDHLTYSNVNDIHRIYIHACLYEKYLNSLVKVEHIYLPQRLKLINSNTIVNICTSYQLAILKLCMYIRIETGWVTQVIWVIQVIQVTFCSSQVSLIHFIKPGGHLLQNCVWILDFLLISPWISLRFHRILT